jgi:hypothetical protein
MNGRERYVLDTNVVVSALLFEQSTPGQAFYAALDRGDILLSLPVLEELIDVLGREKFELYLLREERERFQMTGEHNRPNAACGHRLHRCRQAMIWGTPIFTPYKTPRPQGLFFPVCLPLKETVNNKFKPHSVQMNAKEYPTFR